MKTIPLPLGSGNIQLNLPDFTDIFHMSVAETFPDPAATIRAALENPIAARPLSILAQETKARGGNKAVIVVSDYTRPVPYSGEQSILLPIIETLLNAGFTPDHILVLVAAGTHRAMSEAELRAMIDPHVFAFGVPVRNHDCRDNANLVNLGKTERGGDVYISRFYLEADLKILTGLVESHFMAGFSGGRKSICPGLIGEQSTFVFHGPAMMAHPDTRDLLLAGNPCHEESLEVAKMVGADFIVNVTLGHIAVSAGHSDNAFAITGVFAGDLEQAHKAACEKVKSYVGIPAAKTYDIVVSHVGYVGSNHYQVAKVAVASLGLLKKNGFLIIIGDNRDAVNPVGTLQYRTSLQLLKLFGPERFLRLIQSPDWTFIPEQWQVQMWTKLFTRIPQDHFYYFAPQLDDRHWQDLPGIDGRALLPPERRATPTLADAPLFVDAALKSIASGVRGAPAIAWLADGPYGIPYQQGVQ